MKLSLQEKEALQLYLHKNLQYRETYTEFYDHILSALENVTDNVPFMSAVDAIVKQDFGGYDGMTAIEVGYYRAVTKEIRHKYIANLAGCFKFPLVGITAMLALFFYWLTRQLWFGGMEFLLSPILIQIIPSFINKIKLRGIFSNTKKSIKYNAFSWLHPNIFWMVLIILELFYKDSSTAWEKSFRPDISAIFLLACAAHTLALYKTYRQEFKRVMPA
jgi:hypothetical protein